MGWRPVDEVRYSDRALRPAHFLRVVPTKLDGVSFDSQQAIVPADAGGIDVKEHFGAVGDGVTDGVGDGVGSRFGVPFKAGVGARTMPAEVEAPAETFSITRIEIRGTRRANERTILFR